MRINCKITKCVRVQLNTMQPIQQRNPAIDTTHYKRQKALLICLAFCFSQEEKDKTKIQSREEQDDFAIFR